MTQDDAAFTGSIPELYERYLALCSSLLMLAT